MLNLAFASVQHLWMTTSQDESRSFSFQASWMRYSLLKQKGQRLCCSELEPEKSLGGLN